MMIAVLVLSAGCSKPSLQGSPPTPPSPAPAAAPAAPPPAPKGGFVPEAKKMLSYQTPPEWVAEEPGGQMRKAQYRIPAKQGQHAAAQLTFFSMSAQSTETMVGYWRDKMGGADANVTTLKGAALPVTLVEIAGTYSEGDPIENALFLGAIVEAGERTWYLKFAGPAETVEGWKSAYIDMLKGMRTVE